MSELKEAIKYFKESFKCEPEWVSQAPGRVNIIGEHIDYNDGFVFPMAMELKTVIVGCVVEGEFCTIITNHSILNQSSQAVLKTAEKYIEGKNIKEDDQPKWSMYVRGVMELSGLTFPSFKAYIYSTVPLGAGLSSSASVEVAMHAFLCAISGVKKSDIDITKFALTCQKAEHLYANVPCGIMDQFICTMGQENNILLLDCMTQNVNQIPYSFTDYQFVVFNSNVKHELASGEYAKRRAQCNQAKSILGLTNWRDASVDKIEDYKSKLDKDIFKRTKHVITEIKRVKEAVECLKKSNIEEFGKLMTASHYSLQTDYEVSCEELDELVKLSLQVKGVVGARMTGGGFGGCMVVLAHKSCVEELLSHINHHFSKAPSKYYISEPKMGMDYRALQATDF